MVMFVYAPLVPGIRRQLDAADAVLTFVDVGARNGVIELGGFPDRVDAYGFEPNPAEFEKLVTGNTDAALIGIRPPSYRSLQYFPYAIADRDGQAELFVTVAPAASGLLEPDVDRLREIVWKGKRFRTNFAEEFFVVERKVPVEVRTLASFAVEAGVDHVDYLKVDVEGSEYEVLEGAGALLRNTGVVRVEVCFIPFRVGQRLFSEVDLLLRDYGFDLLRYEIDPEQVGYKERESPSVFGPSMGYADRYGQPLSADAVYVSRTIDDPVRALAQAAVLIDKNYLDEALFVLKRRTGIDDPELFELLRTYRHVRPHHRALSLGMGAVEALIALRHPIRSARTRSGWRRIKRAQQAKLQR